MLPHHSCISTIHNTFQSLLLNAHVSCFCNLSPKSFQAHIGITDLPLVLRWPTTLVSTKNYLKFPLVSLLSSHWYPPFLLPPLFQQHHHSHKTQWHFLVLHGLISTIHPHRILGLNIQLDTMGSYSSNHWSKTPNFQACTLFSQGSETCHLHSS